MECQATAEIHDPLPISCIHIQFMTHHERAIRNVPIFPSPALNSRAPVLSAHTLLT
jgi:hypothetical protein